MKTSYLYLYIIAGFVLLGISIYDIWLDYPAMHLSSFYDLVPAAVLFYIANKAYREKKDRELM
ncbi:hypothetical protein BEL04_15220 [Mucilaginibacter sp. PPCGB 2223]|uniref:hypothetical protein n=1 Tax=Mucilaginibacter sp. PPCGB 2223 TaxID=1886027 RepID=UPI0008266970|nr:hypothetical protein [Mucilaginibacter sp. PPCGB 2223]OCX51379.1 hypothetical protein BEL04_15220 [Mucilaginibacter sp. PPCGB 2223]